MIIDRLIAALGVDAPWLLLIWGHGLGLGLLVGWIRWRRPELTYGEGER